MIEAEKLIAEQEQKPIYLHIYSYYDKQLDRFNQPQITENEPGFVIEGAKASFIKDPQAKLKLAGLCLTYLGKFDIKTGKFELFDDVLLLVDFDKFAAKGEKTDA